MKNTKVNLFKSSWILSVLAVVLALCILSGCDDGGNGGKSDSAPSGKKITLATTTSTDNSGLLKYLNEKFTSKSGISVRVVATGSGAGLKLAERGDCDIVMTHSPAAEEKFVSAGYGIDRRSLMHNDFVIVGPADDPAKINGTRIAAGAFMKIAGTGAPFCSRGDDSGTNVKEIEIWKSAIATIPQDKWYKQIGKGMGQTLLQASEMAAYTLSDRGTFIAMKPKVNLKILLEGDPSLNNPYSVIAVNPKKHSHVKYDLVMEYINWLTGAEGQKLIADFRMGGEQLFFPDAIATPQSQPSSAGSN